MVLDWVSLIRRSFPISVADEIIRCPSTSPSRISPWLMLPPAPVGGDMVYKFYSIADDKVLSIGSSAAAAADGGEEEKLGFPDDDETFLVGSSHGWLALHNRDNSDLFLSNPLSRRTVKLPSIHTLPQSQEGVVSNVIISCSPEAGEDCRAMMTYGPLKRLAFCCPGGCSTTATEWIPIGAPSSSSLNRDYESFVYSTKQKLFYCVTRRGEFEAWDLRDPQSPKLTPMDVSVDGDDYYIMGRSDEEVKLKQMSCKVKFLIVNEKSEELFLVKRYIIERMDADGSYAEETYYDSDDDKYPYKTVGFDVHKYDHENRVFRYMDGGSLDGMAFFIGWNHGFVISAGEFPEVKPDSIYYTDVLGVKPAWIECPYGGHDNGIFSYRDGTISPCYYPCDLQSIKRILPVPMWFTPSSI